MLLDLFYLELIEARSNHLEAWGCNDARKFEMDCCKSFITSIGSLWTNIQTRYMKTSSGLLSYCSFHKGQLWKMARGSMSQSSSSNKYLSSDYRGNVSNHKRDLTKGISNHLGVARKEKLAEEVSGVWPRFHRLRIRHQIWHTSIAVHLIALRKMTWGQCEIKCPATSSNLTEATSHYKMYWTFYLQLPSIWAFFFVPKTTFCSSTEVFLKLCHYCKCSDTSVFLSAQVNCYKLYSYNYTRPRKKTVFRFQRRRLCLQVQFLLQLTGGQASLAWILFYSQITQIACLF